MSQKRRRYDEDFKRNAVKLSYATSKTIEALCEDLGISPSILYRWRRKYTSEGQETPAVAEQEKMRKLQIVENGERNAKKSSGLLCEKPEVKFKFIRNNPEHPVSKWAALLGVSTSGYYNWLNTQPERERQQRILTDKI